MQSTQSLFEGYKLQAKQSKRTERGDLIEQYLQALNPSRVQAGYKPLSFPFLSKFFADRKMSNHQLYAFYQDCSRAKNFSSYFWYKTIKEQKNDSKNHHVYHVRKA